MGRKKVELKRIEDKSSRQVTFSKRRSGLIKKARELSILCDVEVAVVIFSSRGKLYEFFSGNSSAKIIKRYHSRLDEAEASKGVNTKNYQSEYASLSSHAGLLQIVQRQLEGTNVEQMSVTDLEQLEKQIDAALTQTRERKTQLMMESITSLHEKERMLRKENELLKREMATMEKTGDDTNELVIGLSNFSNSDLVHPRQEVTLHLFQ